MTVASAASRRKRDVRCPDCGCTREVSLEQALRIQKGIHSATCPLCRHPAPVRVTEEHRRYWLELGGVKPTDLASGSRAYVRRNGLPDALLPIAASAAFTRR